MREKSLEDRFYFKDGSVSQFDDALKELHREDGPAVVLSENCRILIGTDIEIVGPARAWFFNNELHRDDGAAIEEDGYGVRYFLKGVEIDEEVFNKIKNSDETCLEKYLDSGNRAERCLAKLRLSELSQRDSIVV